MEDDRRGEAQFPSLKEARDHLQIVKKYFIISNSASHGASDCSVELQSCRCASTLSVGKSMQIGTPGSKSDFESKKQCVMSLFRMTDWRCESTRPTWVKIEAVDKVRTIRWQLSISYRVKVLPSHDVHRGSVAGYEKDTYSGDITVKQITLTARFVSSINERTQSRNTRSTVMRYTLNDIIREAW